ncbi:MAG: caspase family protein [Bacteroidota bacterium]
MPKPFHALTVSDFAALLDDFPFTRQINTVHMHHTWRPNHAQDRGHASVEAMWRFHTQHLGWSDIAQHVTIDKHGTIWTGRSWNAVPASARGHNGNTVAGPFMFEMTGDFDVGRDAFEGPQREAVLEVIALVQRRFGLPPEALRFHNEMAAKTCPGTSIDKAEVVEAVRRLHEAMGAPGDAEPLTPIEPFGPETLAVHDILTDLVEIDPVAVSRSAEADAELPDEAMSREQIFFLFGGDGEAQRGGETARARLTPEMMTELRPHVVNLTEGRFSDSGRFQTTPSDVRALFGEHLPAALKRARGLGEPLHVVFYAHGGLVPEKAALETAYTHVQWWRQHPNVYPVYFVWETSLFETIGQALSTRGRSLGQRAVTDGFVEALVRYGMLAPWAWSRMKLSAALASADGGGARFVAHELASFTSRFHKAVGEGEIKLHGIGHSAGSIFHSYFLPAALDLGVPSFETLHFLAPALRVDAFKERLAARLGDGIDHLGLFTMTREAERDDHCAHVYRKSLLYLIHHALEREKRTPILGLEESLRADDDLADLFGLGGAPSDRAETVFSPTQTISGRSATTATTHGGFDNDAPTMQSVLRRILDAPAGEPVAAFPAEQSRGDAWARSEPPPPELQDVGSTLAPIPPRPPEPVPSAVPATPGVPTAGARRRALCVGIDAYSSQPLAGCVADARAWASALRDLRFEPMLLLNEAATREGMLASLEDLVRSGQPGDVLVFQYAGHGTYFRDETGDERDGRDEAFCPVDFDTGAVVLDDEVRELFAQVADGVNLTCFIDCCHSGSITRLALRAGHDDRPRTVAPTPAMRAFRDRLKAEQGRSRIAASAAAMRDVTFSACQPDEVAWERDGQGDFTRRGVHILSEHSLREGGGLTNQAFHDAVLERFGPSPRQTPYFDAAEAAKRRPLLAPLTASPERSALLATNGAASGGAASDPQAVVRGLHRAVQQFERALAALDR